MLFYMNCLQNEPLTHHESHSGTCQVDTISSKASQQAKHLRKHAGPTKLIHEKMIKLFLLIARLTLRSSVDAISFMLFTYVSGCSHDTKRHVSPVYRPHMTKKWTMKVLWLPTSKTPYQIRKLKCHKTKNSRYRIKDKDKEVVSQSMYTVLIRKNKNIVWKQI